MAQNPQPTPGTDETDLRIGARLHELRSAHRLSLRELGRQVDLSPSFLSEVERGIVDPSISALKRIATALDVRLEYFFSDEPSEESAGVSVIRRGTGRKLGKDVTFERLTPDWGEQFEVIFGTYKPGASTGEEHLVHEGFEWGIVLRGRFKIWVGAQVLFVGPDDCISFRSGMPHRVQNISDEVGEYIWVNSPPSL
ncbi:MAG: cupin domain-containing protein [Chloroflexota bacterium]